MKHLSSPLLYNRKHVCLIRMKIVWCSTFDMTLWWNIRHTLQVINKQFNHGEILLYKYLVQAETTKPNGINISNSSYYVYLLRFFVYSFSVIWKKIFLKNIEFNYCPLICIQEIKKKHFQNTLSLIYFTHWDFLKKKQH